MHVFCGKSCPGQTEGFGEKRICTGCFDSRYSSSTVAVVVPVVATVATVTKAPPPPPVTSNSSKKDKY